MLSLTDPRWSQFQANYKDGERVAALLSRAEAGEPLDDWYDELFQELCHQYTVSEAAFPAAPHLVRLAALHEAASSLLLILLGACHISVEPEKLQALSTEIQSEWRASAAEAIPLIAGLLIQPQPDEEEFRYLLASLAAVSGYPALAFAIEGLDCEPE